MTTYGDRLEYDDGGTYGAPASIISASATFTVTVGVVATPTVLATPYTSQVAQVVVADCQAWLVPREQRRASDALWRVGEAAAFVIMWSTADYDAGNVGLCPTCVGPAFAQSSYQQPAFHDCPTCFGARYSTVAHGGIKALLVRPSIWTWDEEQTQWLAKGEVDVQAASVTTVGDVWANRRDYVIRGDGQRFIINSVTANHLSTGYGTPSHVNSQMTVTFGVAKEPLGSPIYSAVASASGIVDALDVPDLRSPGDYSSWEFTDGPLEIR